MESSTHRNGGGGASVGEERQLAILDSLAKELTKVRTFEQRSEGARK